MAFSLIPLTLGSMLVAAFSSMNTSGNVARADNQEVTFSSIVWNNIDYQNLRPASETNYIPQNGYCVMLSYSALFNPVQTDNFVYTNPEYSSHILVNGYPINQFENCVTRIASGNLFIYFPATIGYTSDCFRPTIEIEAGTSFYGCILPYIRLEYKYRIGVQNKWENVTGFTRNDVTFTKIEWNNTHYYEESYPALGGKDALLLKYSDMLSDASNENGGIYVQDRNLVNTVVGSHIKLNNEYFKDIEGAEIRYFNQQFLWLYAPNMTSPSGGDRFAKLEMSYTSVFDKNIPDKTFYFVNNKWTDSLSTATFDAMVWNNIDYSGFAPDLDSGGRPQSGYCFALRYVEAIGTDLPTGNLASSSYDVGSHVLINGVPCKDVTGAMVGPYHGDRRIFYVYFPDSSISYSASYDRPTVEIEEQCICGNYLLPALRLEFCDVLGVNGGWKDAPSEADNPFTGITWNNIGYGDTYQGKNGILLAFTNYLSNYNHEVNGMISNRNLANTDLGKNIKINGVSLSQCPDAELRYHSVNYLWIYSSTMTQPSNGYARAQISLEEATPIFDSIIAPIQLVFKDDNKWHVSNEDVKLRTSFNGYYVSQNNADLGNGYHQTILSFDKSFYSDSSKDGTSLIATNEEFVNKVTLNGVLLKNIPGIFVIYYNTCYIQLVIPDSSLAPTSSYPATELNIPQDTHLYDYFINELTLFIDSSNNKWVSAQSGTIINTLDDASFVLTGINNQITGMSFENRINKSMFDTLVIKYGLENISFGTYIVPNINFKNSGFDTPIEYVEHMSASSATYLDVPNTGKDFINEATASSDGYYAYTGIMYNVKSSHYSEGFIGIGYLNAGDRTYYGNINGSYTTYYELLVQAYNQGLIGSSYFNSILSFTTTSNAYELNDTSVVSSGYSFSYAGKSYYSLSTTKEIRTVVVDGIPHNVSLMPGTSTYFAFYNDAIDFRNSLDMSKGIGEPIYELFPDTTNSNADLNTVDNVSSLNQAFGANAERIWVDLRSGLGFDKYGVNQVNEDGEFRFDSAKVNRLHNYLNKFISKGITELTLLISGWANDNNPPLFLKNGNWITLNEAYQTTGWEQKNIIPAQTNESYQKWLDANENLAYKIAKEFPEFKYIETINEFDGGGYTYSPDYAKSGTIPSIGTVSKWAMDLCHSYSKGIRKAGSSLRVMSPAFSCFDVSTGRPYNTKNFISNCYSYIANSSDPYTNNWFQVMNLHPYVFPAKIGDDSNYLWNTYPRSTRSYQIDNTDYDTDWTNYMNYVHNTIMGSYGDSKKTIAITEFGFSDMKGTTDSNWKHANDNNRYNTVASNMMTKINSLNYIETLIWFRMFDFPIGDPSSAFGGCLEPNFGMIETDKTLKELGKKLYQLWNGGSTNYTAINNYLSTMKGRN